MSRSLGASSNLDPRALAQPSEYSDDDDLSTSIISNSRRGAAAPAWSRRRRGSFSSDRPPDFKARWLRSYKELSKQVMKQYNRISLPQKILILFAGLVALVLAILFLIYNERIFSWLPPYAEKWRNIKGGWTILWAMTFIVAFPPLIGYSTCVTIAGFVYGFPNGWFIVASATVFGSTASFLISRTVLKSMVQRLLHNDTRFASLALTLKHDGLKLLIMIRLCPLPYSLSNGAVSMIPTVHPLAFMFATAVVSPKLLLQVFIGSQIAKLAGDKKLDARTKAISYASIVIGIAAGVFTGWFIYRQTKKRAAQLEAQEREGVRHSSEDALRREYADDPAALEAAETLREDADDISLREEGFYDDNGSAEGYRDDLSGDDDAPDVGDVFDIRDSDEHDVAPGPKA